MPHPSLIFTRLQRVIFRQVVTYCENFIPCSFHNIHAISTRLGS
jgi:hypothetical protein